MTGLAAMENNNITDILEAGGVMRDRGFFAEALQVDVDREKTSRALWSLALLRRTGLSHQASFTSNLNRSFVIERTDLDITAALSEEEAFAALDEIQAEAPTPLGDLRVHRERALSGRVRTDFATHSSNMDAGNLQVVQPVYAELPPRTTEHGGGAPLTVQKFRCDVTRHCATGYVSVYTCMEVNRRLADLALILNPERWNECGGVFAIHAVRSKTIPADVSGDRPCDYEYERDPLDEPVWQDYFCERIRTYLGTSTLDIKNRLWVAHERDLANNTLRSRFTDENVLVHAYPGGPALDTRYLTVDRGAVHATEERQGWTTVRMQKVLKFASLSYTEIAPTLLCMWAMEEMDAFAACAALT